LGRGNLARWLDATPDATVNGFVMQADFKFRGRGVIQTTWRSVYKEILRFILSTDLTLQPDVLSARQRWETATGTRSGQYLKLSHDVNVLSAARQRRALYFGWRTRSMAGLSSRVVPMMKMMMCGVADLASAGTVAGRIPRVVGV